MSETVEGSVSETTFRGGYPSRAMGGPMSYYIFQVLLEDGNETWAITKEELIDGETVRCWYRSDEQQSRLDDVVGWRTGVTCQDVREVIAQFVAKSYGVVARGEFATACDLHIQIDGCENAVTCMECAMLFLIWWHNKYGSIPEGWEGVVGETSEVLRYDSRR